MELLRGRDRFPTCCPYGCCNGPFPLADFTRIVTISLVGTFNVIRLAVGRIATTGLVEDERVGFQNWDTAVDLRL